MRIDMSTRRRIPLLICVLAACSRPAAPKSTPQPSVAPTEHTIVRPDGSKLVYHEIGSGPVLLIHPGGPGLEWSYLRMPVLERAATVVYVEPIGSGKSDRLADARGYTIDRYVDDLEAVRVDLKAEKVIVLGHSHGGFVAQAYALAHPDAMRGLILYDTTPFTGAEWQKDVESHLTWFAKEPWFADAT